MPEQAGRGPGTPLNLLLWLISNLEIYSIWSPLPLFLFLYLCFYFSTSINGAICEYFKNAFIPKMCYKDCLIPCTSLSYSRPTPVTKPQQHTHKHSQFFADGHIMHNQPNKTVDFRVNVGLPLSWRASLVDTARLKPLDVM